MKRAISTPFYLLLLALAPPLHGQTESAYQSDARPLGLDVVAPVMEAASDADSISFQTNELPNFLNYVDQNWGSEDALSGLSAVALDPQAIFLLNEVNVRTYFLSDSTSQDNSLGFSVEDGLTGATTTDAQLIFPEVSSSNDYYVDPGSLKRNPRSKKKSLLPGDFVDLGLIGANQQLDFFMVGNGASGGTDVYDGDIATNPDQTNHIVVYALLDSPFLLIGFEDAFGGGSPDFNDNLFAVYIGAGNVAYLASPEPSFFLMMGAVCGLGFWLYRREAWQLDAEKLAS